MKKILGLILLMGSISARADIASDIQSAVKKFEFPRIGLGSYTKNTTLIIEGKRCNVAVNAIDGMENTVKYFEITVGTKQLGANIENWNYENTTVKRSREKSVFVHAADVGQNRIIQSIHITQSKVSLGTLKRSLTNDSATFQSVSCAF